MSYTGFTKINGTIIPYAINDGQMKLFTGIFPADIPTIQMKFWVNMKMGWLENAIYTLFPYQLIIQNVFLKKMARHNEFQIPIKLWMFNLKL